MSRREKIRKSNYKILIVDDSKDIVLSCKKLLEMEGYEVIGTTDCFEAIKILKEDEISLLIIDYFMPVMSGAEIVSKVREFSNIVILLQTGYVGQIPENNVFEELDIQLFLDKSDKPEKFLSIVAAGIKCSSLLRRLENINAALQSVVEEKTKELKMINDALVYKTCQLEDSNRKLEAMVNIDGLTGAFNKDYLNKFLEFDCQSELCVIMFDIDHFKKLNDVYGHLIGDIILKEITNLIKCNLERGNMLFRFGGDEFIVLLMQSSKEQGRYITEKIRKSVEEYKFCLEELEDPVNITISIGISFFPEDGQDRYSLLKTADDRLYKAKEEGRNRVCYL